MSEIQKLKSLAGKIYWAKGNKNKTAKQCIRIAMAKLNIKLKLDNLYEIELYIAHGVE
tara:strand:+ start:1494 stop:1667 length:174 start_codon:yes stop_codon:yes gene_type:complete